MKRSLRASFRVPRRGLPRVAHGPGGKYPVGAPRRVRAAVSTLAAIVLVAVCALLTACGGDSNEVPTTDVETQIRSGFNERLDEMGIDDNTLDAVQVDDVTCARKSASEASCVVRVADDTGASEEIAVTVDIDNESRQIVWRTVR